MESLFLALKKSPNFRNTTPERGTEKKKPKDQNHLLTKWWQLCIEDADDPIKLNQIMPIEIMEYYKKAKTLKFFFNIENIK